MNDQFEDEAAPPTRLSLSSSSNGKSQNTHLQPIRTKSLSDTVDTDPIDENAFIKTHFQISDNVTVLHDNDHKHTTHRNNISSNTKTYSYIPLLLVKSISDSILCFRNALEKRLKQSHHSTHQTPRSNNGGESIDIPLVGVPHFGPTSAVPHPMPGDSVDNNNLPLCRICQVENSTDNRLVHFCDCKGSLANYHFQCLTTWLRLSRRNACELCNYKFQITYKRLPITKWKWRAFPRSPILWLLICLMVIALNVGLVVMETRRSCVNNNCIFLYMMSIIGSLITVALLTVWLKVFIDEFSKWMKKNHELLIVDPQTGQYFNYDNHK